MKRRSNAAIPTSFNSTSSSSLMAPKTDSDVSSSSSGTDITSQLKAQLFKFTKRTRKAKIEEQQQQQSPSIFNIFGTSNSNNNNNSRQSTINNNYDTESNTSISEEYNQQQQQQQQQQQEQQQQVVPTEQSPPPPNDTFNYALLIVLYTLQGIPMGLSASIPFLLQDKIKTLSQLAASQSSSVSASAAAAAASEAAKLSYNANAIFALCSWPFSLKLLWAPIVDAVFFKRFGRRKSWLVPVQTLAGIVMVVGADFVERQLGLGTVLSSASAAAATSPTTNTLGMDRGLLEMPPAPPNLSSSSSQSISGTTAASAAAAAAAATMVPKHNHPLAQVANSMNIKGVTAFFFLLYFLMATQDIAVDGWALTMLSKENRGRGPICNSIGQNIGYFLSFVGFLAFNDVESSEKWWRPLLGLPSQPGTGLVSLKSFIQTMGYFMLATTTIVALFKRELPVKTNGDETETTKPVVSRFQSARSQVEKHKEIDAEDELDASQVGLRETYHRLWAVCQLPAVQCLFLVLITYRLPTALSDNVKFLKAVELGLSKSTTALLSPTLILPLGILVPIIASKIWHGHPLKQFVTAYEVRVTIVPLLDSFMLHMVKITNPQGGDHAVTVPTSHRLLLWIAVIASTAMQAICNSLQFNAQMTFFASRVDPAIGGSYMTLLNTAANLGGTWPASCIMWLVGQLTSTTSSTDCGDGQDCKDSSLLGSKQDPYIPLQFVLSGLGLVWLWFLGGRVKQLQTLPDDAWTTHILEKDLEQEQQQQRQQKDAYLSATTMPSSILNTTTNNAAIGSDDTTTTTIDLESGEAVNSPIYRRGGGGRGSSSIPADPSSQSSKTMPVPSRFLWGSKPVALSSSSIGASSVVGTSNTASSSSFKQE